MLGLGFCILTGYLKVHWHVIVFKLYNYTHFHTDAYSREFWFRIKSDGILQMEAVT